MDAKKLRARDLMQSEVKTVGRNATLSEAAKVMHDFGVSSLIIEPDEEGDAWGIVTRKDIVDALITDEVDWASQRVEEVMTKPAMTVNMDLSIVNSHLLMLMVGVRRLPVLDGTNLVGILSNTDIFEKMLGKYRGRP